MRKNASPTTMASKSRRGVSFSAGYKQRAGFAVGFVFFALASTASTGGAFVLGPPRVGTSTSSSSNFKQRFSQILPRMSSVTEKEGPAALAVAIGGGAAGSGGSSAAAAASAPGAVHRAQAATIENVDVALGPTAAAEEAKRATGKIVGRLAAKTVARALPGTWWTSGLPKWMHVVRRRMITKEDWLHLHASSGMLYLVGGTLYLLQVIGMELFAGIPQLDTTAALPLCVLGVGLVNTLSSMPMANTRSWVLTGVFLSTMQLWNAWYVSGAYPAALAPADPWLAAASLSLLVISCVEAEEQILAEKRKRDILAQTGRRSSGAIHIRGEDYVQGDAINRLGSYASLIFNAPHLYATLVGSGWVDRLAEAYPSAPALLFHAYVALATSTSISLLAPTLYQRRLIDVTGMSAMQFFTLAPVVMGLIDAAVMGTAATNNPIEIYLGFLH